jgi:hypothetical protein
MFRGSVPLILFFCACPASVRQIIRKILCLRGVSVNKIYFSATTNSAALTMETPTRWHCNYFRNLVFFRYFNFKPKIHLSVLSRKTPP